jgi:hypothetical protein
MEELVRRRSRLAPTRTREAKQARETSSRPTSKILCPTLTYVTRAAADLPLFHGASRKKLLARPATQVQSGGGIVDTGNPTGIRWRESTRSMVDLYALYYRLDLSESGDKVAWIEKNHSAYLSSTGGFRASLQYSRPLIQAMY